MEEINHYSDKEVPKIFQLTGKIMEQSKWLAYMAAVIPTGLYLMAMIFEYQYFRFYDLLKGLASLGLFWFLVIGYVNFSKFYGRSLREGRRSAIIGLICMLILVSS